MRLTRQRPIFADMTIDKSRRFFLCMGVATAYKVEFFVSLLFKCVRQINNLMAMKQDTSTNERCFSVTQEVILNYWWQTY